MSQALERPPRRTLLLQETAAFLGMHPVTVLKKVRAGEIPAAKPGKRWVFLEENLVAYLRGLYPSSSRTLHGDSLENVKFRLAQNGTQYLQRAVDLALATPSALRAAVMRSTCSRLIASRSTLAR